MVQALIVIDVLNLILIAVNICNIVTISRLMTKFRNRVQYEQQNKK